MNQRFRSMFHRCAGVAAAVVVALCCAGKLKADTPACNASSLKGAFGYRLSGFVYDTRGYMYLLGAAGRMVSDGEGNLTGADTYSFDGSVYKRKYSGTYAVNEDCTGSLSVTSDTNGVETFDFVIVNNGAEVEVVQADNGYSLTGTLKLQSSTTQTATPSAPAQ